MHWIMNSQTKPILSVPFQASPKKKDFGQVEVHMMLKESVIESAETEWNVPIVVAPDKDETFVFALIIGS